MATRRLFVALPVHGALKSCAANLPRKGLDARWAQADDLHITLRFLGDVPDFHLAGIKDALARVRRQPFSIDVKNLALFETGRQPVLYAVVESVRKLTTLCADVTDALTPLGFDFGTRPFVPHVTLARLNAPGGTQDYIKRHGKTVSAHWQATEFCLMQSAAPDEKGRKYTVLERWALSD